MSTTTLRHRTTTAAAGTLFFWAVSAVVVAAAHRFLEAPRPVSCLILSVFVVVTMAFAYTRLAANETTPEQALFVGVGWGVLAIVVEFIDVLKFTPTYPLLGSPEREAFRGLMVIAWIAAPALFARRRG